MGEIGYDGYMSTDSLLSQASPVNARLMRLLTQSTLDSRDVMETIRIFPRLSEERQQYVLDNWVRVETDIRSHREKVEREKRLLLSDPLSYT